MTENKTDEYAYRVALILDSSSALGYRMLNGLYRRATSYPALMVRRYFEQWLTKQGLTELIEWEPDAIIAYCDDPTLLKNARALLPHVRIVSMSATPPSIADVVVVASAYEIIALSIEHFCDNGLKHFAMFYTGDTSTAKIQSDIWNELLQDRCTSYSEFVLDTCIEDLMRDPTAESLKEIGAWLAGLPKPVGISTVCDHAAAYLVRICDQLGFDIPADIQLIGCDALDEALECKPHVTSIHAPAEAVGSTALETILKLLNGEEVNEAILRVIGASLIPLESTGILPNQISNIPAAIAYIESHAEQGIMVKDVFEQTQNVSIMTFYRDFKEQTGELPSLYIRRVRLDVARRLLSTTELNITRISELAGFSSSNYFTQTFRKYTGMPPIQFRKLQRENAC